MKVCVKEALVSHVTKSVRLFCCSVTVFTPPYVSPMSVTLRASVVVNKRPDASVTPTAPSMEINAPETGWPLSSTVMLRLEELVKVAPVCAVTRPFTEPLVSEMSHPG